MGEKARGSGRERREIADPTVRNEKRKGERVRESKRKSDGWVGRVTTLSVIN